jgi:hypothetical protein
MRAIYTSKGHVTSSPSCCSSQQPGSRLPSTREKQPHMILYFSTALLACCLAWSGNLHYITFSLTPGGSLRAISWDDVISLYHGGRPSHIIMFIFFFAAGWVLACCVDTLLCPKIVQKPSVFWRTIQHKAKRGIDRYYIDVT